MSKRDQYIDKVTTKLKEWDAELDKLEAEANQSKGDVEADLKKQIDKLKKRKTEVSKQLESLKEASDDAWEDLKDGIDESWDVLATAFDKAKSRFYQ